MTAPHPRTARAGCDVRLLRAAVFAAVCVVLAAGGHALASCATVPLWTLGAGFLGVFLVAAALAGRERALPGIVALLGAGQTVLHTLFGLGQHTAGTSSATSDASLVAQAARLVCGAGAAPLSPVQAQRILATARVQGAPAHHPADALSGAAGSPAALLPSLPMLLGHLLAALVAGWLLRRGDTALLRVMELAALSAHEVVEGALIRSLRAALALVRALLAGLPTVSATGPRPPRTALLAPPAPHTTALQHTVIRRGPPAAGALVLAA
ncbi:hypothetical protein C3489_20690 [Streptomyces sp. Ru71]|uniref:hypothetical protein n=1 Tax=Streptomyces sp. Ru71 TaxID=2080746 RepID=UPI000CDD3B5D|nr:hypothetical protein [Streptomyces sp. Ru71]POX51152.1 hypothetical protein C3489_20690 [Streptomyces sp. Ru71]